MPDFFQALVADGNPLREYTGPTIESTTSKSTKSFAGIPTIEKSKMWEFALEEGGGGERILSFLVDDNVINFALDRSEEGITAKRLPDVRKDDFGRRGHARTGKFQVHKAGPKNIYGTIQGGNKTLTFSMDEVDTDKWTLSSKKTPEQEVSELLKLVKEKSAALTADNLLDTITTPLTADYKIGLPIAALIGGITLGGVNIGKRVWDKITGTRNQSRALPLDVILGAGAGALGAGAFKFFGEANKDPLAPRYNYTLPTNRPLQFSNKFHRHVEKSKQASAQVDIDQLQRTLSFDMSLTPADRRVLLDQLNRVMRIHGRGKIDVSRLERGAFGALIGYILSKFFGGGNRMSFAASALGALIGSSNRPTNKTYDPRGFYHY